MKNILLLFAGISSLLSISFAQNNTCRPEFANFPPVEHLDRHAIENLHFYVHEIFALEAGHTSQPRWECYALYIRDVFDQPIVGITHFLVELYTNVADGYHYTNMSTAGFIDDSEAVWNTGHFTERKYDTTVITHTDHSTYGVMHFCPTPTARNKYERFITFSSSPTPSESLLGDMSAMVADVGFPTEFGMTIDHHADCDYEYNYVNDGDDDEIVDKDDFDG